MSTLNRFYLDNVAPPNSKHMVDMHTPIHKGQVDKLCNVTAAAMAWLITGKDPIPPFSSAWLDASDGSGPNDADRLIAYAPAEEPFDDTYVILVLIRNGKTLVLDSHFTEGRKLTVRHVDAPPEPTQGERTKHILLGY